MIKDQGLRHIWIAWIAMLLSLSGGGSLAGDRPTFRCEIEGRITYSDTACASATEKVPVNTTELNSYTVEPSARIVPDRKSAAQPKRSANSGGDGQQRAKQRCEKIEARLETIQNQLRRGYTAEQGTRLHDKRRELESQRRTERCK